MNFKKLTDEVEQDLDACVEISNNYGPKIAFFILAVIGSWFITEKLDEAGVYADKFAKIALFIGGTFVLFRALISLSIFFKRE